MPAQLTSFNDLDLNRIVFSEPHTIHPLDEQASAYKKLRISVLDDNDNPGDLILNTPPRLMCFGLQELKNHTTGDIIGYQLPLCLWSKKGPSQEEKTFTDTLHKIIRYCQQFVLENKDELNRPDITEEDLSLMNPIHWKNQGKEDEQDKGYPLIYIKLITNRRSHRIMTLFINEDTNQEIVPQEIVGKRCLLTSAIKFENIYVGNKISIHIKLYEGLVKFIDHKKKNVYQPTSILRPKMTIKQKSKETEAEALPEVQEKVSSNKFNVLTEEDEDED